MRRQRVLSAVPAVRAVRAVLAVLVVQGIQGLGLMGVQGVKGVQRVYHAASCARPRRGCEPLPEAHKYGWQPTCSPCRYGWQPTCAPCRYGRPASHARLPPSQASPAPTQRKQRVFSATMPACSATKALCPRR